MEAEGNSFCLLWGPDNRSLTAATGSTPRREGVAYGTLR